MPYAKISFKDAVQMERHGHYILHIGHVANLHPKLASDNPDCSHVLVQSGQNWRQNKHRLALVIADEEAELKYGESLYARMLYNWRDENEFDANRIPWCWRYHAGEIPKKERNKQ